MSSGRANGVLRDSAPSAIPPSPLAKLQTHYDSDEQEAAHGSLSALPKQRGRSNSKPLSNLHTPHSRTASFDHDVPSSAGLHRRSASLAWTQFQQQQQQPLQTPSQLPQPFSPIVQPGSLTPQMGEVLPEPTRDGVWGFYQRNKGLAYVLLAQVFGVLMNVTTRLLELEGNKGAGMHPFQILFVRMAITTSLSVAYMYYAKTPHFPLGLRDVRWLLMLRGIGGFFGVFGMYYSLMYLPLADATVITFIAPIISCLACSVLLKEPFTRMEQGGAFISFLGVLLIARPTVLFQSATSSAAVTAGGSTGDQAGAAIDARDIVELVTRAVRNYEDVTSAQRFGAVCVALTGVLGQAGAFTAMRWIGKRAHPLLSVTYFCAWCTIVSATAMLVLPNVKFLLPADAKEWSYLIFLGICGFLMQFLLSAGLQHEKSSRATNMVYTQMLFALFFDKLVFGTNPTLLSVAGSTLILGSAIYVAVQKESLKQKAEAARAAQAAGEASGVDLEMQHRRTSSKVVPEERKGLMIDMDEDDDDPRRVEEQQRANGELKNIG